MNLGIAHGDLGDYAKQRDVLERALRYGTSASTDRAGEPRDRVHRLGRPREGARRERALAIKERTYGRDHAEVAITLMNLGNAYGALGDYAKARDMLERALAIKERAYGRDHPEVALTLTNLGNTATL